MIWFVNSLGEATTLRPAPRSKMGVNAREVCGHILPGFVTLGIEKFMRELLWSASPRRYQQRQIGGQ